MKVLFINTLYHPHVIGGAEKTVQTLAESLVMHGHQAVVVALTPEAKPRQHEVGGVRVYHEKLINLFWPFKNERRSTWRRVCWHLIDAFNPFMGWKVLSILKVERPDVVQTSNLMGFSCSVWLAAKYLGIPVVQMLHDYYLVCGNSSTFKNGHNCTRPCGACRVVTAPRRALSFLPHGIISLSEATLRKVNAFGAFRKTECVRVIHGAAHVNIVESACQKERSSTLRLGFLGRVENNKGIETLMMVLDHVRRRRPVSCTVAGSGDPEYVEMLSALAPGASVRFLGRVKPDVLFEQIDVLVVPSVWEEPLGRVIYEAYAQGVPCVVSDAGGMKEIVEVGRTGEIYKVGDVESLDAALKRIEEIGADSLRANCLRKAQEFDVGNRYGEYEQVWKDACRVGGGK